MEYLKKIRIYFHLQESFIDKSFMQKTIADSSWALLDHVLTGSRFPCLRYLELFIRVAALLCNRSDFDKRSFLNSTKQCFKSSFSRIITQEPIDIIFILPIRVSRSILNDPSYILDEYSNRMPIDTFDMYDDGYVSEEIDWDYEPSDDDIDDERHEEDYPTLEEFEGSF